MKTSTKSVTAAFLVAVLLGVLSLLAAAHAQQPATVLRVGFLRPASPETPQTLDAFKQGLREHGYVEGRNVVVEFRYPRDGGDRLSDIADDLMRQKPDVVFAVASSRSRRRPEGDVQHSDHRAGSRDRSGRLRHCCQPRPPGRQRQRRVSRLSGAGRQMARTAQGRGAENLALPCSGTR